MLNPGLLHLEGPFQEGHVLTSALLHKRREKAVWKKPCRRWWMKMLMGGRWCRELVYERCFSLPLELWRPQLVTWIQSMKMTTWHKCLLSSLWGTETMYKVCWAAGSEARCIPAVGKLGWPLGWLPWELQILGDKPCGGNWSEAFQKRLYMLGWRTPSWSSERTGWLGAWLPESLGKQSWRERSLGRLGIPQQGRLNDAGAAVPLCWKDRADERLSGTECLSVFLQRDLLQTPCQCFLSVP